MFRADEVTDSQLQQGRGVGPDSYNGMLDCFRKIIKNEGPSRLYRGITAPILMEAPKRYLDRWLVVRMEHLLTMVIKGHQVCGQ